MIIFRPARQSVTLYLYASISGILLAISSLYPSFFLLTWIAFIPLVFAVQNSQSLLSAYILGLCSGFTLYSISTYWLVDFIMIFKGYGTITSVALSSLYWIYCAQMLALVSALTWHYKKYYSLIWLFPILITIAFAYYPTLFSVQVGETQSRFLLALQGISYTGVHGLDFIVALVNILILQAINGRSEVPKHSTALAYGLIVLWFGYGIYGLQTWEPLSKNWPALNVGIVQSNHPPQAFSDGPQPGYSLSYPLEMALTEKLVEQDVDIVIWPETTSNHYYAKEFVKTAFQRHISEWQTPLIFQDYESLVIQGEFQHYSTSTYLDNKGELAGQYRKIKRIPFAEYLPWLDESLAFKRLLKRYLGDFFSNLMPGPGAKVFRTDRAAYMPMICYEVMFPEFVANSVVATKNPDILVVQSNNSWFGDTRQPFQHLAASVLRSVENRLPLVHVINNGPGAIIVPSGRQLMQTDYKETAAYAVEVPVLDTEHPSFYTKHPRLFILGITTVFLLMMLQPGLRKLVTRY
ncbi:MAG: apolipoprotein N-acyltransferase [Candidatus Thiodiazotropha sp.]